MISQGFKRSNTSLGIITGPCKVGSYVYGNSKQSQKKKESQNKLRLQFSYKKLSNGENVTAQILFKKSKSY